MKYYVLKLADFYYYGEEEGVALWTTIPSQALKYTLKNYAEKYFKSFIGTVTEIEL